jgi:hypothetical protein
MVGRESLEPKLNPSPDLCDLLCVLRASFLGFPAIRKFTNFF